MTVKKSVRTLGKHTLLNKILGKQVRAMSQMVMRRKYNVKLPAVFIDLCAGDGIDSLESGDCSPNIINRHATWLDSRLGDNSTIRILVEKDISTFDKLRHSPYSQGCNLINGDANSIDTIKKIKHLLEDKISLMSPVFIQCDPNHAGDFIISAEHLYLTRNVLAYGTIGCNAMGIKRWYKLDDRMQWFQNTESLVEQVKMTQGRLDCCLISLQKDAHQWGYLVTVPSKWRCHTIQSVESSFKYWPTGYRSSWMTESDDFNDHANAMFLTKKEYADGMRIKLV